MAEVREEDVNKNLLCMRHCISDCNIFFLTFPANCPVCFAKLTNCSLLIPPFRIPSPFVSNGSGSSACKVLLKPTKGSFLSYKNGDNLHVGLSNSEGVVFNFDERGLMMDVDGWSQCIAVDVLFDEKHSVSVQQWNEILEASKKSDSWIAARYDSETKNCYDYVLCTLIEIFQGSNSFSCKRAFIRGYIIPATKRAARFISLYREVFEKGLVVKSTVQE